MIDGYTPLEQFLYDTGIAMPGDVRRRAAQIESFLATQRSQRWEYAQGFETDYYSDWYIGKSFGDDPSRPVDEGYTLLRRSLGPWEVVES